MKHLSVDMDEVTLKGSNAKDIEVDLPILPTANIFIKGEPEFEIVRISSSDEYDDNEEPYVNSVICNDHDVINIDCDDDDDDDLSNKEVVNDEPDDDDNDQNVWPVHVKLETVCGSIGVNDNEGDDEISDDDDDGDDDDDNSDSCKDSDDYYSDGNIVNYTRNGRKRKKLSKFRKKKKNVAALTCNICYCKFDTNLDLSIHIKSSHNSDNSLYVINNKYICLVCKKEFSLKSSLDIHISNAHTEKRTINCIKCNKAFEYRSYLTRNNNVKSISSSAARTYQEKRNFTCFHCKLYRSQNL